MKKYEKPAIDTIALTGIELLQHSNVGPGANDVGNPDGNHWSVWDSEEENSIE